jgi:hypothetical protein
MARPRTRLTMTSVDSLAWEGIADKWYYDSNERETSRIENWVKGEELQ